MVSTDASDGHYFDDAPSVASKPRGIELTLPDVFLELTADSGVFASNAIDKGTNYLLRSHPPLSSLPTTPKSILDLGCGYGPIALTAAKRAPEAAVWGVDVNERALALAKANASANSLDNVHVSHATEMDPKQRFDLIISNPPIRIGKTALHELLATWLDRLEPSGRAWMVVQKHLGSDSLAEWMTAQGWETTRLGSRSGFRILESLARKSP